MGEEDGGGESEREREKTMRVARGPQRAGQGGAFHGGLKARAHRELAKGWRLTGSVIGDGGQAPQRG